MSSTSLRAVELLINGEPGALVTVAETPEGTLAFNVKVTDVISGASDKVDIADLRGLFFEVTDETLLSSLKVTGTDVTGYVKDANHVMKVDNDVTMNGAVGKAAGPFDIGIAFGTQGIGKDDIRETSFTLSASKPLTLEFVLQQNFGLRLTSVSENGVGRELSLKLAGQMTGTPKVIGGTTPPGDTNNPDPQDPDTGNPLPGISYDDLIEAGDGNDTIYGGLGNDEMQGEGGDDLIIGGKDNGTLKWDGGLSVKIGDNLYGNDGNDTFLYKKGDGVDMIWDFQPGRDVIKLSGYTRADVFAFTIVGAVENRIGSTDHEKIAIILNENGDAIVFNDYPAYSYNDVAIVFADGSTLSSGAIRDLAFDNRVPLAPASTGTTKQTTSAAQDEIIDPSLILYGSNDGDTIIGGLGKDVIYGNEGSNALGGFAGDDMLYGGNVTDTSLGRDTIVGGEGNDTGYGNGGDDTIVGGAGSDKLYGAGGNDLVFGDDSEGIDLPSLLTTYTLPTEGNEVSAAIKVTNTWWGGFQAEITVTANRSVNAWDIFLKSQFNIESIWGGATSAEASSTDGAVYEIGNAGWNGSLYAGQKTTIGFTARTGVNGVVDAAQILKGLSITDSLSSVSVADSSLTNLLGNTMRGYAAADTLVGSSADDTFYVDNAGDKIVENSQSSTQDKVVTSVSHTLETNVENMSATGSSSVNLVGNSQNNTIDGNAGKNAISGGSGNDTLSAGAGNDTVNGGTGNDKLNGGTGNDTVAGSTGNDTVSGGTGNDTLYGGLGKDYFVFSDKLNKVSNVDTLTDFSVKDDTILLENAVFTKLTKTGTLNKEFFAFGTAAKDGNDYILYDKGTGYLRYDADGSGKGAAVVFGKLAAGLTLTNADFYVI
ncbi:MAG TPA: calcium-binding protein [Microvirga sp.]|nr:calcium-binding protein [Microvirga sp.]